MEELGMRDHSKSQLLVSTYSRTTYNELGRKAAAVTLLLIGPICTHTWSARIEVAGRTLLSPFTR